MPDSAKPQTMTPEQYLRIEAKSTVRHEFVDGQVFAMTGSTEAHNVICLNLATRLHNHLRGTRCRAFITDMKLHVERANSFYYPDIMVTCDPFEAESVYKSAPVLIVEILSSPTKQIDLREKRVAYRKLESLCEYVIVHQNKIAIELYRKDANGQWNASQLRKGDSVAFESLPGSLMQVAVADIYEGVELPSIVEDEEEEYEIG